MLDERALEAEMIGKAFRCMARLNHSVKGRNQRRRKQVYELKRRMIRVLYQQGFATGVFLSQTLYEFHFRVGTQRFVWHQPMAHVDYPIHLGGSRVNVCTLKPLLSPREWRVCLACVRDWLREVGG